ncbi:MAG: cell division protein DivIVA [Thermoleophilia bacterium]|nr:cell division protein DivIVA [Thermoleophilia bacterium]
MTLSPFEVERREFSKTPFGYKPRDVDQFLDEVHRTLSELWQERVDIREETEVLKERLTRFEQLEDQLKNTLLLAQDSAERAHEQARRESDLIMREAGQKARDIVHVAHEDKQRLEMVLRDLRSAEQEARQRLRSLSGAISSHLDDTEHLVQDGAAKLMSVVQAQPESSELRSTSIESMSDMAERAALVAEAAMASEPVDASVTQPVLPPEPAVSRVAQAERIALDSRTAAAAIDLPVDDLAADARPARMRHIAASETADAFFDSPPEFDPTESVSRRERAASRRGIDD